MLHALASSCSLLEAAGWIGGFETVSRRDHVYTNRHVSGFVDSTNSTHSTEAAFHWGVARQRRDRASLRER